MEYVPFGKTGMKVSRIVLGTWYLPHSKSKDPSGLYPVDRVEAAAVLKKAVDLGVNFFDTADVYKGVYNRNNPGDFSMVGNSERILGESLAGFDRESFVVATKVMGRTGPNPNDGGLNRKHIRHALKMSLERLGTDYVDVYIMHSSDRITGPEFSVRSMNSLIGEGEILHYAASNHSPAELQELYAAAERNSLEEPSGVQEMYNLIDRQFEKEMLPTVSLHGGGAMIYSPLAQGVLAGRYSGKATDPSRKDYEQNFKPDGSAGREKSIHLLSEFARTKGAAMSQVALAWLLSRSSSVFPVVGATSLTQLEENVEACSLSLTPADLTELDAMFDVTGN